MSDYSEEFQEWWSNETGWYDDESGTGKPLVWECWQHHIAELNRLTAKNKEEFKRGMEAARVQYLDVIRAKKQQIEKLEGEVAGLEAACTSLEADNQTLQQD